MSVALNPRNPPSKDCARMGPAATTLRATRPPLHVTRHTSAEQTAPASSLMKKERAQSQDSCKVSGRLRRVCYIQIDIRSVVIESANPPGVRNGPRSFCCRISSQASDDIIVQADLRAEIDKGEGLGPAETPRAARARES